MPNVNLKDNYTCIFPMSNNINQTLTKVLTKMNIFLPVEAVHTYAHGVVNREVWKAKDDKETNKWLISTLGDPTAIGKGYNYGAFSDRGKLKNWAKNNNGILTLYKLDDTPVDEVEVIEALEVKIDERLKQYETPEDNALIEKIKTNGPNENYGDKFTLAAKTDHEITEVQHFTQKGGNRTIFFKWDKNVLTVVGIGEHFGSGNTQYKYIDSRGREGKHYF
jgi:hypothetical protein